MKKLVLGLAIGLLAALSVMSIAGAGTGPVYDVEDAQSVEYWESRYDWPFQKGLGNGGATVDNVVQWLKIESGCPADTAFWSECSIDTDAFRAYRAAFGQSVLLCGPPDTADQVTFGTNCYVDGDQVVRTYRNQAQINAAYEFLDRLLGR
jgi:hypothetical protein